MDYFAMELRGSSMELARMELFHVLPLLVTMGLAMKTRECVLTIWTPPVHLALALFVYQTVLERSVELMDATDNVELALLEMDA